MKLKNFEKEVNNILEKFEKKYNVYFEWKYNLKDTYSIWPFLFADDYITLSDIIYMLKNNIELDMYLKYWEYITWLWTNDMSFKYFYLKLWKKQ